MELLWRVMTDEKYEYKVCKVKDDYIDSLESEINHYAKQGWRIVSSGGAGAGSDYGHNETFFVIMERRVS